MTRPFDLQLDQLDTEGISPGTRWLDGADVAMLATAMQRRDAGLAAAVEAALPSISGAIEETAQRMILGGRLVYIGAGTSGRLGVLDASEVPPTFGTSPDLVVGLIAGGPAALVTSVEGAEDSEEAGAADLRAIGLRPADTVVGIASSGRTPYVLGAVRHAAAVGALTVGLSCNRRTPLSAAADHGIELLVGPEFVAGSTRLGAGTATKTVLNMFSTITMIRLGKTYRGLMVDMRSSNQKLARRAIRIVMQAAGIDEADARRALDEADGNAKVAIAIARTGLSGAGARAALDAADGVLSRVVGP